MKILLISQYAEEIKQGIIPSNPLYRIHFLNYHLKVYQALLNLGHQVIISDGIVVEELIRYIMSCELIFPIRHDYGYSNGDVLIRLLCKKYDKKCIGANIASRFYDTDKIVGKLLCKRLKIPTIDYFLPYQISNPTFAGPYLLKPRFSASSANLSDSCIFDNAEDLRKALNNIPNPECFFIEKFVLGTTATIGCIIGDDNHLILGEPYTLTSKTNKIISFEDKRNGGCVRTALTDKIVRRKIKHYTDKYFREIQPCQIARLDFILTQDKKLFFLEINETPNLSATGGFAQLFVEKKFNTYENFINHLIKTAISLNR